MAGDAPDPIDVYVGSRLRAERLKRRLSQAALAEALDLTFQQVQKYERGTNRISASKLLRAAQFLGVSVASLFPDTAEPDLQEVRLERIRHGSDLADAYEAMSPQRRALLAEIAREMAGRTQ